MKNTLVATIFLLGLSMGGNALAWIPNGEATQVREIIVWEEGIENNAVVFSTGTGHYCFVRNTNSLMYGQIVALIYAAQARAKTVSVHCHDATENIGGYSAHKLHRFIVLP